MSGADYGERGGIAALRATPAQHSVSRNAGATTASQKVPSSTITFITPEESPQNSFNPVPNLSHAEDFSSKAHPISYNNLDLPEHEDVSRNGLLRDAVFAAWKDDATDETFEDPEEMQKKDPLGTQIWKLYSRTKTRLPNQERMENLTWRMMAMNLRRREQMQALYVITCIHLQVS